MRQFIVTSVTARLILPVCLVFVMTSPRPLFAAAGGSITGRVVLVGEAPQRKKITVTKDKEKCGREIVAQELIVSSKHGIKNAVVSLAGVKGDVAKLPMNPPLNQRGCSFNPRILVVPTGSPVDVLNNDGILHNIHTHSTKNTPLNKAQPRFRKKIKLSFDKAEVFKVTCDVHPWMVGWIVVTDHPYAVATDETGGFKLADVPAGTHTIEVWHEVLGKVAKTVEVKAGEEIKLTIELGKGK